LGLIQSSTGAWTEEDDESLIEFFHAEMEIDDIACKLGRTPVAVRFRLRHLNLIDTAEKSSEYDEEEEESTCPELESLTSGDIETLEQLFREGASIDELSDDLKYSPEIIRNMLKHLSLLGDDDTPTFRYCRICNRDLGPEWESERDVTREFWQGRGWTGFCRDNDLEKKYIHTSKGDICLECAPRCTCSYCGERLLPDYDGEDYLVCNLIIHEDEEDERY
jgi:hypothetical protein